MVPHKKNKENDIVRHFAHLREINSGLTNNALHKLKDDGLYDIEKKDLTVYKNSVQKSDTIETGWC